MQWNPDAPGEPESAVSLDKPRFSDSYFFSSICFVFRSNCQSMVVYLWRNIHFLEFFLPRNWKLHWQKMAKLLLV